MKRTLSHKLSRLTALMALCALTLMATTRAFAADQDFTLHNATGLTITELYISPTTTDEWEEDVLGVDTLADGAEVDIKFSPKEEADKWDLKIVDSDGDEIVWKGLVLTEITDVTIYWKDGKAWARTQNGG